MKTKTARVMLILGLLSMLLSCTHALRVRNIDAYAGCVPGPVEK